MYFGSRSLVLAIFRDLVAVLVDFEILRAVFAAEAISDALNGNAGSIRIKTALSACSVLRSDAMALERLFFAALMLCFALVWGCVIVAEFFESGLTVVRAGPYGKKKYEPNGVGFSTTRQSKSLSVKRKVVDFSNFR